MDNQYPPLLGVNIDHVATIRQARGTRYPDPVHIAMLAERAGADAITIHLREDRRHIQERDVRLLKETLTTRMNLELAIEDGVLSIAEDLKPQDCCIVPERREELTTEGGLDVAGNFNRVKEACDRLANAGIRVSLFVDPDPQQIVAAARTGAPCIEIHTGFYADAVDIFKRNEQLERIISTAKRAHEEGLQVNAGHGLDYQNVVDIASIPQISELNIGHSIISEAMFSGIESAVARMKHQMAESRLY